jgi:hypothetical protein
MDYYSMRNEMARNCIHDLFLCLVNDETGVGSVYLNNVK